MSGIKTEAPGGAEPSVADGDREPYARRKAAELLLCAAHPSLVPAGGGFVTEDSRKADREAQIGLAWAMVYLADSLHGSEAAAFGRAAPAASSAASTKESP